MSDNYEFYTAADGSKHLRHADIIKGVKNFFALPKHEKTDKDREIVNVAINGEIRNYFNKNTSLWSYKFELIDDNPTFIVSASFIPNSKYNLSETKLTTATDAINFVKMAKNVVQAYRKRNGGK